MTFKMVDMVVTVLFIRAEEYTEVNTGSALDTGIELPG